MNNIYKNKVNSFIIISFKLKTHNKFEFNIVSKLYIKVNPLRKILSVDTAFGYRKPKNIVRLRLVTCCIRVDLQ